jgi:hypothetical protein
MANETEKLLQAISEDLGEIHLKWLLFCQLYEDEEIVDLLNESAPTFFGVCQSIFLDDIILSINRLTDPSKTCGKENLTLASILDTFEFTSKDLTTDLQESLKVIKDNCSFIKKHRDRRISHSDLKTYFKDHPEPLPVITKEKIENALLGLRTFVNKLELHLFKNEIGYEYLSVVDGASNLVGCLNDAKIYREQLDKVIKVPTEST